MWLLITAGVDNCFGEFQGSYNSLRKLMTLIYHQQIQLFTSTWLCSVGVITPDFESYQISGNPGSIPGTTFLFSLLFTHLASHSTFCSQVYFSPILSSSLSKQI